MFPYLRTLISWAASAEAPAGNTGTLPVNFQRPDASADKIARDVDYAIQISEGYLYQIGCQGQRCPNRIILELGPGQNLGGMMLLACHGAQPIVADRFLAPWNDEYHPKFYTALRARLQAANPGLDVTPFDKLLRAGGYDPAVITCLPQAGESLEGIASGSIDIALSNAVLEHLVDPPKVFSELARVTRMGGIGMHQVDFRDHRDFSRPLEYLLLDPERFVQMFADCHGECGVQWRPHEYNSLFVAAGFDVLSFDANDAASDTYLDGFIPRLRTATGSRYINLARDLLAPIGGRFHMRRVERGVQ
jgi:hypothetical protein